MRSISESCTVGNNVTIGQFVVIEDDVIIGDNCIIGNHVVLHKGIKIGDSVRIDDHTVIGKNPMYSINSIMKKENCLSPTLIKNNCIIGTHVVLYNGCTINNSTLIADFASIREHVTIGKKTIIGRGVAIENYCSIGSNCKLETNAYITAYSTIEDYVFIAPNVITSNDAFAGRTKERFNCFKGVTVKKGARIGAGATILPNITLFEDAFVAAGSVVTRNVPKKKIIAGNPAKHLKDVPINQLLENQNT